MSASGLVKLVFFDDIMNYSLYLNILRDNSKLSAQNLSIGNNFIYNPKHIALNFHLWCLSLLEKSRNVPVNFTAANVSNF